jgi:hypothetical protein
MIYTIRDDVASYCTIETVISIDSITKLFTADYYWCTYFAVRIFLWFEYLPHGTNYIFNNGTRRGLLLLLLRINKVKYKYNLQSL